MAHALLTIRRTRDLALVRSVLTHPTQFDAATDDASPAAADWTPNGDERIYYLEALQQGFRSGQREAEDLLGIFTLIPQNAVCYEIHAAVLPIAWGPRSTAALEAAIAWAFERSPARRIVASIPATNRLAIALAKRAGLEQYGTNRASFLKRGQLVDQILFGISPKPRQ